MTVRRPNLQSVYGMAQIKETKQFWHFTQDAPYDAEITPTAPGVECTILLNVRMCQ